MVAPRASAHATSTRERLAAVLIATLLVVFRAYVFIAWEQSHFDADQAIVGLMAKHLLEGRAFPLYFYGQQYLLGIEPLLVAPAFALGGISVATLKIPLLIANIVAAAGLILSLERWAGVRPLAGLVAALFFILPPPGTASRLVQANGCNIEPFLYLLALWWLRDRPLGLGLVAGVGLLNREFTAYGVTALGLTELARGRLISLDGLRRWTITVVAIVSVVQLVNALVPLASAYGPGTSYAEERAADHATEVAQRFCWNEGQVLDRLRALVTTQAPEMFGAQRQHVLSIGIVSGRTSQGADWLWPVLLAATLLLLLRTGFLLASGSALDRHAGWFCCYLMMIGVQAMTMYAVMCGQRSHLTMRYMLLGLLLPIGLWGLHMALENRRAAKVASLGVVLAWATISAAAHGRLLREYIEMPPTADHRLLANHLVSRGIRHARANFWDAYHVTFLTAERVRVASSNIVRIREYGDLFELHESHAVLISTSPCNGSHVARWWVCPAGPVP
jgi:hypothetical protein